MTVETYRAQILLSEAGEQQGLLEHTIHPEEAEPSRHPHQDHTHDNHTNKNNHSGLLSLWNLKIVKDTLRLLPFHLRMLPCAVTIVYSFGSSRGLCTCINLVNKSWTEPQLECTYKGNPTNKDQTPV
jgi:hypothetical protein